MGLQKKEPELWGEPRQLFARIPPDNPLRRLAEVLKLEFVYEEVAATYGKRGNVSVDPAVIVKMMLLLFLEDIKSERELMRIIPLRLDYLWFLGFDFDEVIPNHSVLSKARRRWGQEVFERLFVRSVQQCVAAGLVEGRKLHVDASLIDANASIKNLVAASPEVVAAIHEAFAAQQAKLEEAHEGNTADQDDEQGGPQGGSASGSENKLAKSETISRTDPDAAVARHSKRERAWARYKTHRAVDDLKGVILATETSAGDVHESHRLIDLVEQSRRNLGRRRLIKTIVADSAYGTNANLVHLATVGCISHLCDLRSRQRHVRAEGIFGPEGFRYDPRMDVFICPNNEELKRRKYYKKRGHYEYVARKGACAACVLRAQCTRSAQGRTLKRNPQQEFLDQARRQAHSRAAQASRKRRAHVMEGSFAQSTNRHHFKRARWRGLGRQQIQDWLIAAAQNLRLLVRALPERAKSSKSKRRSHRSKGLVAAFCSIVGAAKRFCSPSAEFMRFQSAY